MQNLILEQLELNEKCKEAMKGYNPYPKLSKRHLMDSESIFYFEPNLHTREDIY